jgi:hypothetical protein
MVSETKNKIKPFISYSYVISLYQEPLYVPLLSYRNGIYLVVHNRTTKPITLNGGINIKSGAETYVAVSRTFNNKLEAPYSDCVTNLIPFSDYSETLFGYFYNLSVTTYNKDICLSLCYQDNLLTSCRCISLKTLPIKNANYCVLPDERVCADKFDLYFSKSDPTVLCHDVCRQECTKVTYSLTTSQATYPTDRYLNDIISLFKIDGYSGMDILLNNKSLAYRFAEQSLLKVTINYDQNSYLTISESPKMDAVALLANIGGQLSLFLGISIFSFVGIFELLIELVFVSCCKTKKPVNSIKVKPVE